MVGARQYVGARYVPIFGRGRGTSVEWDNSDAYEPLSIVYYQGDTYTSRRYVPAGIAIDDQDYWVITGRYNAQVEQYRQEVLGFDARIDANTQAIENEAASRALADVAIRESVAEDYIPFPDGIVNPKYGTEGQVLTTLENGETKWEDPVIVTPEIAGPVIADWLDDHPEATTTVLDNSITNAKLVQSGGILSTVGNIAGSIGAYDSTKTYECGDLCVVDGSLYVCWYAITTPEAFASWKWAKTTLTEGVIRRIWEPLFDTHIPWIGGTEIRITTGEPFSSARGCATDYIDHIELVTGKVKPDNSYKFSVAVYEWGNYLGMLHSDGTVSIPNSEVLIDYADLSNYGPEYSFRLTQYNNVSGSDKNATILVIKKKYANMNDVIDQRLFALNNHMNALGMFGYHSKSKPAPLTIAQGTTGYNTYKQLLFYEEELDKVIDKESTGIAVLILQTENYEINPSTEIYVGGPSGTRINAQYRGTLFKNEDGTAGYALAFTRPDNDWDFIAINFQVKNQTSLESDATITLIDGYILSDKYIKFISDSYPDTFTQTTITVGIDKQYTSLRSALEQAALIASKQNHVTVEYYGNGNEYDVMDDITSSDLTSDSTFIGLTVPAYTKLLGMGSWIQNKISLELPANTDPDAAFRISTINLIENAELENLWFVGSGCRYACHDDTQTYNPDYGVKTIKNCRFTSDFTNQHRAYGAGYRSGIHWRFENCIFENINGEETQHGNAAFSAHNNNAISRTPSITFINCQFSGGHGVSLESLNRTSGQSYPNAKTNVSFYGCKITSGVWSRDIITGDDDGNGVVEIMITGFGNNFDNADIGVYNNATQSYDTQFDDQFTLWGKITEA